MAAKHSSALTARNYAQRQRTLTDDCLASMAIESSHRHLRINTPNIRLVQKGPGNGLLC